MKRRNKRVFNYCQTSVLFFISGGILSGYLSLLALHLCGTPSLRTGSRPPSCFHFNNRPCMYKIESHFTMLWYFYDQINRMICHFKDILCNWLCVTLINFLPLIKRVSQFLIKGELFLEREGEREGKRERYIISLKCLRVKKNDTNRNVYLLWPAGIKFLYFPNT